MRERAEEIGGSCEISSRANGGTLVTASLPRHAMDETAA
jgi:signal transduction histidine kinase